MSNVVPFPTRELGWAEYNFTSEAPRLDNVDTGICFCDLEAPVRSDLRDGAVEFVRYIVCIASTAMFTLACVLWFGA